MVIQRQSPVPLYYQIMQNLIGKIEDGTMVPGEPLPSEGALCETYGVSRITIRKVVAELLSDGYVSRKRPRGQLIIRERKLPQNIDRFVGLFSQDVISSGAEPRTQVVSLRQQPAAATARFLFIGVDEPVYRIERVHYAGDTPLAVEVSVLPEKLYPGLESRDLSQSLVPVIEEGYNLRLHRARQWVTAIRCGANEARHLGIRPGTPVLQVRRVSFNKEGVALEYFVSTFRPDRYEFYMEIYRERVSNAVDAP